ncbi:hypothetical protein Ahy_A10g047468 isoform A [Arachis hypogaea]|uniref:Cytochrome P450 85A n=1 Tax=Arachis hypogaea TaxID=3818 RepID=A0A445B2M6_ARAHY|nr:hypothetical protein Ahy_A10g047468 isoform A [Arachis hypogaea]
MAFTFIAIVGGVLFLFCFFSALLRWNEVRYMKKNKGLPPGTMGWPLFGETTEFLKQGPNFMKNQRARYGSFFKSHILGCPTIVSMDAELNRYILMNESKGLVPGYPKSMLDILGKCNIAAVHGSTHKYLRGALLSIISPTMIRDQLLPKIDHFMRSHLSNWDNQVINIQHKTKEMAFLSSLRQIAGKESSRISDSIMPEFFNLARKAIVSIVSEVIEERRKSQEIHKDMLGGLMGNDDESRHKLSDEEIIDLVITVMYSGYETVSATSMMAVKYLQDHPKALEELREEHLNIRQRKKPDEPIDFNDLKSMRFTRAVIFETSRLATIVNGVLRKTTQDMELNCYLIPKGWKIYVYTREINYDHFLYPDPLKFNPWRWLDKSLETKNHCLIFGGGTRLCPGKELGIAEISTFLHYLVTRYRWEEVGGDKLLKFPRVQAPNGLHIRKKKWFNKKIVMYGSFFKSHILGSPTIISMDEELNRYILMNESKGIVPGYPKSMVDILGNCNIAAVHGSTHKYLRGALLSIIGPTMVRDQLLTKIDHFMRSHLSNWDNQVLDIQRKTKEMTFLLSLMMVVSMESSRISDSIMPEYFKMARKALVSILREVIEERRKSQETHRDMLGVLMGNDDESRQKLSDEEIIDLLIAVMYSGYETVSATSMMAVKYLQDHPKALEELREEHLAIRQRKKPDESIDFNDLKSMRFTRAVIFETARLATIVNGVLRKTIQDVELNGYLIPKGWKIYVFIREINYDPFLYPEPLKFNPWRWLQLSAFRVLFLQVASMVFHSAKLIYYIYFVAARI